MVSVYVRISFVPRNIMVDGYFFFRLSVIAALSYEASAFSASFTNALKDTKTTDENVIVLQKPNIGHCLAACNFVEGGCQSISWHNGDKNCHIVKNDGNENDGDNELTVSAPGWVYYKKNEQTVDFDQTFMKPVKLINKEAVPSPSYTPWNWQFSFDVHMTGADGNDQRTGEIIRVTNQSDINSIVLSVKKKTFDQLVVTFERDGTQHEQLISSVQNGDSIILNFTRSHDTPNQQRLEITRKRIHHVFPVLMITDTNLTDREIKVFYSKELASNMQTISSIPPLDGGWSSWSGFSSCTLSCGSGTQYRTRACDNPASQYGGKHCEGYEREEKSCNINPCSAWSSWSCKHCSKTAIRTRTCHHGCPSKTTETKEMCQIESSCFPDKVISYNTGLWGSWRSWEYCPKGTWVVKLQTNIESHQGDGDDTALNAISLRCNDDVGATIKSGSTNWGTWQAESQKCINGFYGGMLKFESSQGSDDDDTSTNAIRLICRDDNQWYRSGEGGWGSWTQSTYCPAGYKIVGLQTQIESDQGSDDDTSLNGVRLLCRYFG